MNENSDQVTGLVKELLSLNDADSAPTDRSSERRRNRTTAVQTEKSQARTGARPLFVVGLPVRRQSAMPGSGSTIGSFQPLAIPIACGAPPLEWREHARPERQLFSKVLIVQHYVE
jgi:hypothetical protein